MSMWLNFGTIVLLVFGAVVVIVPEASSNPDHFELPPVPKQPAFKSDGVEYDDGGLGPLYNFARSFINSCFPGDPMSLVKDIIDGKVEMGMDMVKEILKTFAGYVTALVIGILFIIIFPIVGCCFCCCRLCCKACCDRPRTEDPKTDYKKKAYGTIFFVLVVFSLVGNISVYLSNDRITTALEEITKNTGNNLDDFDTFLNATYYQVEQIGTNFNTTNDKIIQQLDATAKVTWQVTCLHENPSTCEIDISKNVADDAVQRLTGGAVHQLQNDANSVNDNVTAINNEISNINAKVAQLGTQVPGIPVPSITIQNPSSVVGASSLVDNVTAPLKTEIDNHVSGMGTTLNDAKSQINGLAGNVEDTVKGIQRTIHDAGGFDIKGLKTNVNDFVDDVKPFDHYRWIGGLVLAAIITLIVALQFFGLVLGVGGSGCKAAEDPTDKGCLANSGGRLIVASIVFIFLFSSLLMLLTTVLFGVGSVTERFACQPLTDPDLKKFDDMLADFIDLKSVLQYNQSSTMTPAKILKNCRENKAVYDALDLNQMTSMPLKFEDLESNVKTAIANMKAKIATALQGTAGGSYAGVDLTTHFAQIDAVKTNMDAIPFSNLESQVSSARTSLNTFKDLLDAQLKVTPNNQNLNDAKTKTIPSIEASLTAISDSLTKMKAIQSGIGSTVTDVKDQLRSATTEIQKPNRMSSLTDQFTGKIENIVKTFMNFTKDAIQKDLGKCKPIWNLYHSVFVVSLCQYTLDSLNGFWFSIGWCLFFFIPSVVIGIKLSNQFRNTEQHMDEESGQSNRKSSLPPILRRQTNKVGHQDF